MGTHTGITQLTSHAKHFNYLFYLIDLHGAIPMSPHWKMVHFLLTDYASLKLKLMLPLTNIAKCTLREEYPLCIYGI